MTFQFVIDSQTNNLSLLPKFLGLYVCVVCECVCKPKESRSMAFGPVIPTTKVFFELCVACLSNLAFMAAANLDLEEEA